MFPIYGCAAVIAPVYRRISFFPAALRGCLYAAGIFLAEFSTGTLLKHFGICPWDYSGTPLSCAGSDTAGLRPCVVRHRTDFEKILSKSS